MYRFKDKRPQRQSPLYSGSETNPPPIDALSPPALALEWPAIPRKVSRFCVRICLIIAASIVSLWYLGPRIFLARRGGILPGAIFTCDTPLGGTRARELANTFAGYKHFGETCNISSLDLHRPFDPVCDSRTAVLAAMSSGGRIGRDAPYISRGCDMQWYTTEEVCEILGRFSQVVLVGDSMLRHVIGALNVIIRENLGYGGVTDWNFDARERERCFCNDQFDVTDCSVQGIYKTEDVFKHDYSSLVCPTLFPGWSTDLRKVMVRYPIEQAELERLETAIDTSPTSRKAFILGHGLWNDLEIDKSRAWLDTVIRVIDSKLRLRMRLRTMRGKRNLPILFVTPNAAGEKKPDEFIVSQGNKALVRFEHAMRAEAARQRIDHLGTWNMSVQAHLYDGVHMDMRGNLLKAMMVLNWLDMLDG